MPIAVRGIRRHDEEFLMKADLLFYLAKFGESPRLSDEQRQVVSALIISLRRAEYVEENWRDTDGGNSHS